MSAFEGYLNFGGNELVNNSRVRRIAETAECPMYWLKGPECATMQDALGDSEYSWNNISAAPWYDPTKDDVSRRFFGLYAYSWEPLDSTRQVQSQEGIADGGVIGRTRKGMKSTRLKGILLGRGRDAIEYGQYWLNAALDPGACGQHNVMCGLTDLQWFADCPPRRGEVPVYGDWLTDWTNLAQNPSFEVASGTVEVRRNLLTDPGFEVNPITAWLGANATIARNPESFTVVGGFYSMLVTPSAAGGGATYAVTGLTSGRSYTFSAYVRTNGTAKTIALSATNPTTVGTSVTTSGAGWLRASVTFIANATTSTISVAGTGADTTAFFVDGALLEETSVVRPWFDGGNAPRLRINFLVNPSAVGTTTGWGPSGAVTNTIDTIEHHSGVSSLKCVTTGAAIGEGTTITCNASLIAAPGDTYSGTVWVKAPGGAALYAAIRSASTGDTVVNFTGTGDWQKIAVEGHVVPSSGVQTPFLMVRTRDAAQAITFYVDDAVLERGAVSGGDYFDGATTLPGYGFAWTGSANTSASFMYDLDYVNAWVGTANASASTVSATGLGSYTGPDTLQAVGYRTADSPSDRTYAARAVIRTTGAVGIPVTNFTPTTGVTYTLYMRVRPRDRDLTATPRIRAANGASQVFPKGVWTETRLTVAAGSGTSGQTGLVLTAAGGHQIGDRIDIDAVVIATNEYTGDFFDGETADVPGPYGDALVQFEWAGTKDASNSLRQSRTLSTRPQTDDEYADDVNPLVRYLHGVAAISGSLITETVNVGDFWAYYVEIVFQAERPWVFGKTRSLDLPPVTPILVEDITYNRMPYPSAELASGTVTVQTNFALNPSAETNVTGWATSAGTVTPAPTLAQSNELASAGTQAARSQVTATNAGTNGYIEIEQEVPIGAFVAGKRFSVNLWASALVKSGTAVLGTMTYSAYWRQTSGGSVLRTDDFATAVPAAGGAKNVKSVLPPTNAAFVLVRARVAITSWSIGAVIAIYGDALAVTNP